ncbi:MAG: hypothetical protein EAX96_16050 [Candidatus Lokiarchaeota archaeon]|nr:hypothetical protein [Candidatus Lokiarchaeota archaeon]
MSLYPNMWNLYKDLGWERFHEFNLASESGCYDFFETRFNESISTSQEILSGKMQTPEKILSYILILPNVAIRADLMQGTQRLLAGDSLDVTYIILKHDTQEVFALLNGHLEAGLPVDWWFVQPDDEVLNRRHRKLGHKLFEIPKKIKDLRTSSFRLIDIFKDIRNERTPEWATADYMVISAYETFALNLLYEPSSYESICQGFDGWAAKEMYKLPDYAFALIPWPQMINMFLFRGRKFFTLNVAGLTTENNLYISPFEEKNAELVKELHADIYEWYQREKLEKGVPYPIQTLDCEYPNLKNKKDKDNRFNYLYPPGDWILPSNLDLTAEEFQKGVYLAVNHETPVSEKVGNKDIISIGVGRNTIFFGATAKSSKTGFSGIVNQSRDELFSSLPPDEAAIIEKITSKLHVSQIIQLIQKDRPKIEEFFNNYGFSKEDAEEFIRISQKLAVDLDSTRNYFMNK